MADDGRTHLQEILGGRASELSESSARCWRRSSTVGAPMRTCWRSRRRATVTTPTAQRSARASRSPRSMSAASPSQAPNCPCASSGPDPAVAGDRVHARRRLAARQHRLTSGRLPRARQRLWVRGLQRRLSVGGPEFRFPTAVEDCYGALTWVQARAEALSIDPGCDRGRRRQRGWQSGNGDRDAEQGRRRSQAQHAVARVPGDDDRPVARIRREYEGFLLYRDEMQWHQDNYLAAPEQRIDPRVSPLDHGDLAGLPPTLIITAQCDPLHAQGELYAARCMPRA